MIRKIEIDCTNTLVVLKTTKTTLQWKYAPATEEGLTSEMKRIIEMIRAGTTEFI